ncbi:hypothetical protein ACQCSU_01750 [Pseudarthrobacter sp. O4]|uniref:hypothetical protein n=1 Tax=Pseudarthrobacter sp. O4 TaxID=3418417 RepID=UPI003CEE070C
MPDVAKVEVGYGVQKSWLEQWGQVERSYKKVQNLYAGTVDNQEALTTVKDFFIHSWHLGDWLKKDPEISVKHEDIGTLLQSEPDLQICNAFANTSKHHTLDRANAMSARVSSVVTQPQGQVTIEISTSSGTETRDALELATSCMGIWRKFLHSHGLRP